MNLHVRGYKEKGNIDTPLELAIRNQTDRFSLAMDAIDRMPHLRNRGASARQSLLNAQIKARNEAFATGVDPSYLKDWTWPHTGLWNKTVSKFAG
jgi:xylulose-5-phosphate/fructose-6-phosphate phosphoketolase